MATKDSFSLIRGRRMRVTRLNGCGVPLYGDESTAVTDGFISVAFSAQTTEAEVIEVVNANGQICARDTGSPQFNGYSLELTFCGVQPCLFEMLTGQPPVLDANGETVGFRMNTSIDQTSAAFALELWAGVPGVACDPSGGAGSYGYVLVPFVSQGVIGDFTIENGAVNFVVTGASSKDGNSWGAGPYSPVEDVTGAAAPLPVPLDADDHLYVVWTSIEPPPVTDGCELLPVPAPITITGVTAGIPGSFAPANATLPANLAALKADPVVGDAGTAKPTAAWGTGEYVVLGDASQASWNATAWVAGAATVVQQQASAPRPQRPAAE